MAHTRREILGGMATVVRLAGSSDGPTCDKEGRAFPCPRQPRQKILRMRFCFTKSASDLL